MANQNNGGKSAASLAFIRGDMTTQEKLQQWETEYVRLHNQVMEERKAWEEERNQSLLLLSDYRRDNQQLEIEKRQWEQEREFGFKLIENLRQRVNHYVLKIQMIAQFYNIDIAKLDNMATVNSNMSKGTVDAPVVNEMPSTITKLGVGNESTMTNGSDNNVIEELFEQGRSSDLKHQAKKMFERKRQESEDLRKECQSLEQELKELRRKQARTKKRFQNNKNKNKKKLNKGTKARNSKEETIDTMELAQNKQLQKTNANDTGAYADDDADDDDTLFAFDDTQLIISENELLSELTNAWSDEFTNLLKQFSTPSDGIADENFQEIAEQCKTRMKLKSNQALEKHRNRRMQFLEEDEEDNDNDNDNDTFNGNDNDNDHEDRKTRDETDTNTANEESVESQETSNESKRYFTSQMPPSRIVLSKLSNRKDTELDIHTASKKSTTVDLNSNTGSTAELQQKILHLQYEVEECRVSKNILVLRTALEIERMRELLKSYNPNYRYRRILDRLLEDNRYQALLDRLADETYQPDELDALLAHIGHLKYQNKFKQ